MEEGMAHEGDNGQPCVSFSDARPGHNVAIGLCGVGVGIFGIFLGPMVIQAVILPEEKDPLALIFYGMNVGFALGAGPGVILGGRLQKVTGRWWGAILGSLFGMAVSFQLQTWFEANFLMLAYFVLPPILAVAGYQPIRPRSEKT